MQALEKISKKEDFGRKPVIKAQVSGAFIGKPRILPPGALKEQNYKNCLSCPFLSTGTYAGVEQNYCADCISCSVRRATEN